jgi:hypothetical protein
MCLCVYVVKTICPKKSKPNYVPMCLCGEKNYVPMCLCGEKTMW